MSDQTEEPRPGPAPMEDQRDNWIETANQYARNADYWRDRAESAEANFAVEHADNRRLREALLEMADTADKMRHGEVGKHDPRCPMCLVTIAARAALAQDGAPVAGIGGGGK